MITPLEAPNPKAAVSVLDLKGGEVLVLRFERWDDLDAYALEQWQNQLNALLAEQGKPRVQVLVLTGDEAIEALDVQRMRAAGWVRKGSTVV